MMNQESIFCQAFAPSARSMTLNEIAQAIDAKILGDGDVVIEHVGTLQNAESAQITFLNGGDQYHKYRQYLSTTKASALITTQDIVDQENTFLMPVLIHQTPRHAIVQVIHLLFPKLSFNPGCHPSAIIGEHCTIHPKSYIGPNVVIGDNVTIGENVIIKANTTIGDYSTLGDGTFVHANVNIYSNVRIGKQVMLHSGVVLGSDGFGFVKTNSQWTKIPQIGGVVIGDRVEIGANTVVDRGAIDDTVIGNDVILDNLIQIGHNVKIGDGTAVAACVGIAGSSEIGKNCLIGGASNISGHLQITDQVSIVGCSNVGQSISQAGAYASALTVTDIRTWKKNLVRFHQLDKMAGRLTKLESRLQSEKGA